MSAAGLERDFDGRTALVTGGAGGIGLAIARQLAQGGARVVLVDLERQALDVAAASLAEPRHHLVPQPKPSRQLHDYVSICPPQL